MIEGFNTYDELIQKWAARYQLPWRLIKAQVWQESDFDCNATSSCGAMGLMQLMPGTAREMGIDTHEVYDPDWSIYGGVRYDRLQYDHFPEIPDPEQRLSFMLAAYNGGRGYINRAVEIAYENEFGETMPKSHRGRPGGWQKWGRIAPFLYSTVVSGKRPDSDQIINYVDSIWEKYHSL